MAIYKKDKLDAQGTGSARRALLKSAAFLGGCGALMGGVSAVFGKIAYARQNADPDLGEYEYLYNKVENIIYSACLQCHAACSIKCKVVDGVLVKIDGNPWCPQNNIPNVPYAHSLQAGVPVEGRICPKGQAGIETLYDPYRIRKVLKRKPGTPRGGGEWITVDFNQAVTEVVEGGNLFGEGRVDGLRDVYALRDREAAKAMSDDVSRIKKGEMTVAEFKATHAANLDALIDPDHPDLGPKNNQFVFLAGRIEHGRKELMKWFTNNSFGSVNAFEHTTICEQSHHIAFEQVSNQWKDGKWQKGKHHMKPDLSAAEFVIFFGTGFAEANFGPPTLTQLAAESIAGRDDFKFVVVDPRCSKTAGMADKWIPIKPGGDGAFAMGMIRWIIDNERFDRTFLKNANPAAAVQDDETCWTSAPLLVKMDGDRPATYLRADEVGLGSSDEFVVSRGGQLAAVDINNNDNAVEGDLEAKHRDNGIFAKSAFLLLKERSQEMTIGQYAKQAGVESGTLVEIAKEFTSHGKRSVAEFYRGPVQHTNGYYSAQALIMLNLLVGNPGWKGGLAVGGGHWHEFGGKPGNPYDFKKIHPDKFPAFGVKSNREGSRYSESTLFTGYPAKRPWYPFTGNLYQEVIPSAADGYPYPIKVLLIHKGTPVLSCPAGHKQIDILRDPRKVPLFIACDIVVGETSMYADYIFPDTAVWERWGTPHITPAMLVTVSKVRQPTVGPLVETTTVDGVEMPMNLEALLIAHGKELGLPGIGNDAFGAGRNLDHQDDWFLKAVANIAMGDRENDAVPAADEKELGIFRDARAHLPRVVFDEERLKRAAGDEYWPHVVTVLNRGGRFEDTDKMHKGDKQAHAFKGIFLFFVEKVAAEKNSISGKQFDGLPRVEGVTLADGSPAPTGDEYPFNLITYKDIFGGHSRTAPSDKWLRELREENTVLMNRCDARHLGIKDGERVRLGSPTNPNGSYDLGNGEVRHVGGKLETIEGIRPGVVAVSWHFGHWAYGSRDIVVDDALIEGDPDRGGGIAPNPVMLEDTVVGNVCLTDPIGGSSSFYDTPVKVVRV